MASNEVDDIETGYEEHIITNNLLRGKSNTADMPFMFETAPHVDEHL